MFVNIVIGIAIDAHSPLSTDHLMCIKCLYYHLPFIYSSNGSNTFHNEQESRIHLYSFNSFLRDTECHRPFHVSPLFNASGGISRISENSDLWKPHPLSLILSHSGLCRLSRSQRCITPFVCCYLLKYVCSVFCSDQLKSELSILYQS